MSWLEAFYGIFFQPTAVFRFLAQQQNLSWAILTNYMVYFFNWLVGLALGRPVQPEFIPGLMEAGTRLTLFGLVVGALFLIFSWLVNTAVIDLLAQFFGGQGQGPALFVSLGFIALPGLVGGLTNLVVRLLNLPQGLISLSWLVVVVWMLALTIIAVREIYQFPQGRAATVVLLPGIALLLCALLFICFFVFYLVPYLQNLFF